MKFSAQILISILLAGCMKPVKTDTYKTSDLKAYYSLFATSGSTGVSCTAYFTLTTSGASVDLDESEVVTCNGEKMTKSGSSYSGFVSSSEDGEYTISLIRSAGRAYPGTVKLPTAIAVISPSAGAAITKGQPLTVTWSPSSESEDSLELALYNNQSGNSFIYNVITSAPETGSVTFAADQTQSVPPVGGTWSGYLQVTRKRTGTMPPSLQGVIEAQVFKAISVSFVD